MATDTAPKQTDTKPAEPAKATTPAQSTTPAKATKPPPAKATAKTKPKPRAKMAAKPRAKTAAKPRAKTAAKPRSRKPAAARTARTAPAAPLALATVPSGGQPFVAGVIDAQEKPVAAIVDYQTRAAELSQIPGVTAVAQAQAKVLRSVTDTYVSAARALLK